MIFDYQGKIVATFEPNVRAFLESKKIDPEKCLVEVNGEIYEPGSSLEEIPITEDLSLHVYQIVSGG